MFELLAPAGNMAKLKTALHFGADAVYIAGKRFGLRTYAGNFDDCELAEAVRICRAAGKKLYVAVNIFAKNSDFSELENYLVYLQSIGADGAIISDPGVVALCRKAAPKLDVHLSTQANTTNKYAARFWREQGVKRIVLARELSLSEVKEISDFCGAETEIFVHGAMCVSYSGRCLLSNYLSARDSNRGECVQACRWNYNLKEAGRGGEPMELSEDGHGSYILNSKDLNMISRMEEVMKCGAVSFKIEGRMKSEYYVATVVNAYRRTIDALLSGEQKDCAEELEKVGHRTYTGAGFLNSGAGICLGTSKPSQEYRFAAVVLGYDDERGLLEVEMRNRFAKGDVLEALSPAENFNAKIQVGEMYDSEGNAITDAKLVQQRLYIETDVKLLPMDILRSPVL